MKNKNNRQNKENREKRQKRGSDHNGEKVLGCVVVIIFSLTIGLILMSACENIKWGFGLVIFGGFLFPVFLGCPPTFWEGFDTWIFSL